MRIAYVTETYPPEVNGVALTVERTVRQLRTRGHAVMLARPAQPADDPRDDADEWRTPGGPIPLYRDLRFGLASTAMVRRRLLAWRPQVVHVATPGPLGWSAVRAARQLGLAATSDFRTNFHHYSHYYGIGWLEPALRAYLRRLHNRTRLTFVPTVQLQSQLAALGFNNLQVVGRGVDTRRFSPERRCAATRSAWQAEGAAPVLLHVGRLAAEKNVALALTAFEAVRRTLPAARMIVVGDGPLRGTLERRFPAARFVGVQRGDDLERHYASADLFLFPSLSETFGNVVLEALASGLPVVAFRTAAAGAHVESGRAGLLAAPGDDAAFIAAAGRYAAHPAELAAARLQARTTALALSWDAVLDGFAAHLESTLHAHQAATTRLACAT